MTTFNRHVFKVEYLGSRTAAMRKIEIQYPSCFFYNHDPNAEHPSVIRFNTGDTVHLSDQVAQNLLRVPCLRHPVWQDVL